ncbi:MAG: preprotein translocase subunit YajC [Oscillospiraceae bacterium]|nr:preprotein translocase subunit YajC [Oscillospiraceae bacterium]
MNFVLAAATESAGLGGMGTSFVMILVMIAIFYFLLIRPENKKKKEANNMRNALKVGDNITTIGGITGTVCAVKEETIVIETGADRVRIEFTKWAVSSNDTAAAAAAEAKKNAAAQKKAKKEGK